MSFCDTVERCMVYVLSCEEEEASGGKERKEQMPVDDMCTLEKLRRLSKDTQYGKRQADL